MAHSARYRLAIWLVAVAAWTAVFPSALADAPTVDPPSYVLPSDGDIYLPDGWISSVQELDAIRQHVKDVKSLVLFTAGLLVGINLLNRVL